MSGSGKQVLGILGGMGPMASCLLYETITKATVAQCDQDHLDILLYSHASMPDRTHAIAHGKEEEMIARLVEGCKKLEAMGAGLIAVPCNTSHYFLPQVAKQLTIPLLDMVTETVQVVAKKSVKKVSILATEGTISMGLYHKGLAEQEITVVELPCFLQEKVNHLIYQEIKAGKTGNGEEFSLIEDYLKGQEVDCIILACTELSVFRSQHPLSHTLYVDALEVLSRQCVAQCGGRWKEV